MHVLSNAASKRSRLTSAGASRDDQSHTFHHVLGIIPGQTPQSHCSSFAAAVSTPLTTRGKCQQAHPCPTSMCLWWRSLCMNRFFLVVLSCRSFFLSLVFLLSDCRSTNTQFVNPRPNTKLLYNIHLLVQLFRESGSDKPNRFYRTYRLDSNLGVGSLNKLLLCLLFYK